MRGFLRLMARFGLSAAAVAGAIALAFGLAGPSVRAGGEDPAADVVLIRYADPQVRVMIQDSKWGPIGRLQTAIDQRAEKCGVAPVALDGRYTRETAEAMRAVAACRGAALGDGGHMT